MTRGGSESWLLGGRPLPWRLTPVEALRRWPVDRPVAMLHSGRLHERWARWTILAEPIGAWRFDERKPSAGGPGGRVRGGTPGGTRGRSTWIGDPATAPAQWWSHQPLTDLRRCLASGGLWIGYLGYDLGRWLETLPTRAARDRGWPIAQLQRCGGWLIHDGADGSWRAGGDWEHGGEPDLAAAPEQPTAFSAGRPRPRVTRAEHEAAVRRVIEYIAAGDAFQVNLAQRFTARCTGDPRALYASLSRATPAWYGAYLECLAATDAEPRRAIASASPELFLEASPGGTVVTRPIKGTRPTTVDAAELRDSPKDAAELAMIVDLLRNDLGRVATFGSVRVEEARAIETHPSVHHGVATITSRLRADADLVDLLAATMPGGSITGAPKVRAMEIIEELEPVRRGPYCGTIGYVHAGDGTVSACFNIAIRTLLVEQGRRGGDGRVDFSVGGGIVGDSTPEAEYQETLDKAAALMTALKAPGPA